MAEVHTKFVMQKWSKCHLKKTAQILLSLKKHYHEKITGHYKVYHGR